MKSKNLIIALIALVVLIVLAITLKIGNQSNNFQPYSDFAIADTASITKFKISNTQLRSIVVSRRYDDKKWRLNEGKYEAKQDAVNLILETINQIELRQNMSFEAQQNTIRSIGANHTKVEFFNHDEENPFKTYFIGQMSADLGGSIMLLQKGEERSSTPYIVHKPGITANLATRFFINFYAWRDSKIFRYPDLSNIKSIELNYFEEPGQSFRINMPTQNKSVELIAPHRNFTKVDTIAIQRYVSNYKKVHYERLLSANFEGLDKLKTQQPFAEIKVTENSGTIVKCALYRRDMKTDEDGAVSFDQDNMFVRLQSGETAEGQYFVFDPLLKPLDYFIGK